MAEENEGVSEDDLKILRDRLASTQKILENKEEVLKIQEETIKNNRFQIMELSRVLDAVQLESENKDLQISNLQHAINLHTSTINELQRDRLEVEFNKVDSEDFSECYKETLKTEIEEYQKIIESLKFDLDIMEYLYKNCYDEVIKQDKTIECLRQAYFEHYFEDFNNKVNVEILVSEIKQKNNALEACQDALYELDSLKKEIVSYTKDSFSDKNDGYNLNSDGVQEDINNIAKQLFDLQKTLVVNDSMCENVKKCETCNFNYPLFTIKKMNRSKRKIRQLKKVKSKFKKLYKDSAKSKYALEKEIENLNNKIKSSQENKEFDDNSENNMKILKENLSELQEKNHSLSNALEETNAKLNESNEKFLKLNESNVWLQHELWQASENGKSICAESENIHKGVRRWIMNLNEEKWKILSEMKQLQEENIQLREFVNNQLLQFEENNEIPIC